MSTSNKKQSLLTRLMSGSLILKDSILSQHWKFILFVFFLALTLIASNYIAEGVAKKTAVLKKEAKELRYKQISIQAEKAELEKQSSLALRLDTIGIKESVVPPIKINVEEKK